MTPLENRPALRGGFRLSRNYSFADKQERTVGRSKVVRKFLYRNFLPPEVQKGRYPCAASRPRCADTCSPFLSICRANAISCALPRKMLKNADYTTFSTDRNRPALRDGFLCLRNGTTYIYLIYIHLRYAARRGEHCSPAQGKWTRINNICRLRGTARRVVPQGTFSCGVAAIHLVAPCGGVCSFTLRGCVV